MPVVLTLLEGTIVHVTLDMRVMDLKETATVSVFVTQVNDLSKSTNTCISLQI